MVEIPMSPIIIGIDLEILQDIKRSSSILYILAFKHIVEIIIKFLVQIIISKSAIKLMRRNCKEKVIKIISQLRMLPQNSKCKDCVLVLDNHTSHFLSLILPMQEIIRLGIKQLCRVDKKKKPIPQAMAIYFIECKSIQFLFQDFKEEDIYFSINLLVSEDANKIMKQISQEIKIMERLAYFGELYLPCNYIRQNLAYLVELKGQKNETLLCSLFSKKNAQKCKKVAQQVLKGILSSFQINQTTSITIYAYKSVYTSDLSSIISSKLEEHIKSMRISNEQGPHKNLLGSKSQQIILIMMDREIDMMGPLIRSFNYLPCMMDLYDIKGQSESIKIISNKITPTQLSQDDQILSKYKCKLIYEAFQEIEKDLEQYINTSKAAQFQKQKKENSEMKVQKDNKNTEELREIIRQLPDHNKIIKSYHTNISIMEGIGKIKKQRNIDEITQLEHLIITGVNGRREPEKDKNIIKKVWNQLSDQKSVISPQDRCRLLLLSIIFLQSSQKNQLIKLLSQNSQYGDLATKISTITRSQMKKQKKYVFPYQNIGKKTKQHYVNRHHTVVGNVVHDILVAQKQLENFSMKKLGSNQSNIVSKMKKLRSKPNIVVFMAGTLGYNQFINATQVYENSPMFVSADKQNSGINFITDQYVTQKEYLKLLNTIR